MKANRKALGLKSLAKDERGDIRMIGAVVGILVTLVVAALVFFNIMASIDTTTLDAEFTGTPVANATTSIMEQSDVFFSLAPIIAIVIVAVVILGYVSRIGS